MRSKVTQSEGVKVQFVRDAPALLEAVCGKDLYVLTVITLGVQHLSFPTSQLHPNVPARTGTYLGTTLIG